MISVKLRIIREKNRYYNWLLRLLYALQPESATVFLFHDILDNRDDVKSQFAITQKSFESFLSKKIEQDWSPISFADLSSEIKGNTPVGKKQFIVSFDDANTSVFTKAYPFLKSHGIPFIVFITKGLIGKENFLSEKQIKLLAADPLCTIGSHGLHHIMFRYLSEEEALNEYRTSQIYLEQLISAKVSCFAFPYGRFVECSNKNIKALSKSGYEFSFSAIAGNLQQQWVSGVHFLPRVNVDEKMVENLCN